MDRNTLLNHAFDKAVAGIIPDIPLLMYGAGDVPTNQSDPGAVNFLASLTTQYMAKLVDAAMDVQDMLRDNPYSSSNSNSHGRPMVPPPSRKRSRYPPKPPKPEQAASSSSSTWSGQATRSGQVVLVPANTKKRPKRANEEYWDDPLPTPRIRNRSSLSPSTKDRIATANGSRAVVVAAATSRTTATLSTTTANTSKSVLPGVALWPEDETFGSSTKRSRALSAAPAEVNPDEWVGAVGVDWLEQRRVRDAYVSPPNTLESRSFVFCLCHDAYCYGRIIQIQSSRRTLIPLLTDPILVDLVRTESKRSIMRTHHHHHHKMGKSGGGIKAGSGKSNSHHGPNKPKKDTPTSDPEEDDEDEEEEDKDERDSAIAEEEQDNEEEGPMWPGLDELLPIYRNL